MQVFSITQTIKNMAKTTIALDKSTLPKDGQYCRFTTDSEEEKTGYYIESAGLFTETKEGGDFTSIWMVTEWQDIEEKQLNQTELEIAAYLFERKYSASVIATLLGVTESNLLSQVKPKTI